MKWGEKKELLDHFYVKFFFKITTHEILNDKRFNTTSVGLIPNPQLNAAAITVLHCERGNTYCRWAVPSCQGKYTVHQTQSNLSPVCVFECVCVCVQAAENTESRESHWDNSHTVGPTQFITGLLTRLTDLLYQLLSIKQHNTIPSYLNTTLSQPTHTLLVFKM